MKFCYGVLFFVMAGCATTSSPKTVSDVKVGDSLTMTDEKFLDCTMVVKNIITIQSSPIGVMDIAPTVCGILTCKKSIPEAMEGVPACLRLEVFQPAVKPKAKTK